MQEYTSSKGRMNESKIIEKPFNDAYLCVRGGKYGHEREFYAACRDELQLQPDEIKLRTDALEYINLMTAVTQFADIPALRGRMGRILCLVEVPVYQRDSTWRDSTWEDAASVTKNTTLRVISHQVVAVNKQYSATRRPQNDGHIFLNGPQDAIRKAQSEGYNVLEYSEETAVDDIVSFFRKMAQDLLVK